MRKKVLRRLLCCLLTFLMVFEPLMVPMLRAEEASTTGEAEETEASTLSNETDQLYLPQDMIEDYFESQGISKEDQKDETKAGEEIVDRAWNEWNSTLTSAYMGLDEGATDALTFYTALKNVQKALKFPKKVLKKMKYIAKYTTLGAQFLSKVLLSAGEALDKISKCSNVAKAFTGASKFCDKIHNLLGNTTGTFGNGIMSSDSTTAMNNLGISKFFSYFSAPTKVVGDGVAKNKTTGAYWKWVKKVTGNGNGEVIPQEEQLSAAQGAARTAGVALAVLNLGLSIYDAATQDDNVTGFVGEGARWSRDRVESYIGVAVAALTIVLMFVPGPGWVIAAVDAVWTMIKNISKLLGEFNEEWKKAYFVSSYFLKEKDENYKSFYNSVLDNGVINEDAIDRNEMSDSLIILLENYKDCIESFRANPTVSEDDEEGQRNIKIVKALQEQCILTSYYAQVEYELNGYDINYLQQLWDAKQGYMAFKPTEEEIEEEKNKSTLSKIGDALNPLNWAKKGIRAVGNGIASGDYYRLSKDKNVKMVYFNPDYILIKRYRDYITSNKLDDEFHSCVGLRIEQSPFNYLPLVGLDSSKWNIDSILEAILGDSFAVAQKELNSLSAMVENMKDEAKDTMKTIRKKVDEINDQVEEGEKVREIYSDLAELLSGDDPDESTGTSREIYSKFKKWYGKAKDGDGKWNPDKDEKTPLKIAQHYKSDIENTLLCEPISLSYRAYDVIVCMDLAKSLLDKDAIINNYYEQRKGAYDNFDDTFKTITGGGIGMNEYLKKGEFLNGHGTSVGSKILDWFSGIYTIYDETSKGLIKLNKAREKYSEYIEDHLKCADYKDTLRKINNELDDWKDIVTKFAEAPEEADIRVILAEKEDIKNRLFVEGGYKLPYKLEAVALTNDYDDDDSDDE